MYGLRGAPLENRVQEILEIIGLTDRQKGRVANFSGGMKRRLNIGIALLHKPDIVIMDEPTVGIDPQSRRNILDNVLSLNQNGMTVLYTTHYMEEAQELSSRIAIMDHGEMIAEGTHEELVKIVGEYDQVFLRLHDTGTDTIEAWRNLDEVSSLTIEDTKVCLLVEDGNAVLPAVFEIANQYQARISSVEIKEPNLEAVFLHLTGRALRD
jgi:ABC-2 type transport system ATP-binding protein